MTFLQNKQKTCSQRKRPPFAEMRMQPLSCKKAKEGLINGILKHGFTAGQTTVKNPPCGQKRSIPHRTVLLKQWAECGQIILSHRPG